MKKIFVFADFHCHPTLKTYGHTFENSKYGHKRRNIWFKQNNSFLRKLICQFVGLTKFSQADFTTLKQGNVKIVTASLYPFEKGFFINLAGRGSVSAFLANIITGISYYRIRNIQKHTNYFQDLEKEYLFLIEAVSNDNKNILFFPTKKEDFNHIENNKTAVVISIEGAHVFNSGLNKYGRETNENEVINNIYKVKKWKIPPVTITFAHNFINDFCGHAKSLEPLGVLVDQNEMLNQGFTELGFKVIDALLNEQNGKIIYPDLKHMSLKSRMQYYDYLKKKYSENKIPIVVSHGAVTGCSWATRVLNTSSIFCNTDINFYDEEILKIAESNGLFAIQLDGKRLTEKKILKELYIKKDKAYASAEIIWKHIEHIAVVLDENDLFSWNVTCIGSDFDGTIEPLPGIYTAEDLPLLAQNLTKLATSFLLNHNFKNDYNYKITSEEIIYRFCYKNINDFYYRIF